MIGISEMRRQQAWYALSFESLILDGLPVDACCICFNFNCVEIVRMWDRTAHVPVHVMHFIGGLSAAFESTSSFGLFAGVALSSGCMVTRRLQFEPSRFRLARHANVRRDFGQTALGVLHCSGPSFRSSLLSRAS